MQLYFPLLLKFYKADSLERSGAWGWGERGRRGELCPPRVAKRAAAGGEAGLRGAASSGRSPRARGAAQLLLTPCAPKAIGETCNTATRAPELSRDGQGSQQAWGHPAQHLAASPTHTQLCLPHRTWTCLG